MLKVLFWLLLDSFFAYILVSWWDEMGSYIFLIIGIVAFFTWELVNAFKEWLK